MCCSRSHRIDSSSSAKLMPIKHPCGSSGHCCCFCLGLMQSHRGFVALLYVSDVGGQPCDRSHLHLHGWDRRGGAVSPAERVVSRWRCASVSFQAKPALHRRELSRHAGIAPACDGPGADLSDDDDRHRVGLGIAHTGRHADAHIAAGSRQGARHHASIVR